MKTQIFAAFVLFAFLTIITGCQADQKQDTSPNTNGSANAAPGAIAKAGEAQSPTPSPTPESSQKEDRDDFSDAEPKVENRCGWFFNPTPGNAWLNDKDGQWIIGAQGGHQADGDWAEFSDDRWVATNGSYGYGCACMRVTVDRKAMKILKIVSASSKPLSQCRRDKALSEPID